ncbi:MAG: GDP-mannose 4,6-dehydratase [Nannocystaceae bacterium]|nr:GDP-mannose 4,6-dehydratase [Nannocystaceae bacterium]
MLVTGADGFMGSHLTERLLGLGAEVSVLVRPRSVTGTVGTEFRNLGPVADKLERVFATDVAGPDAEAAIAELCPSVIFHLAADAYVERSFSHPREVLRTNMDGTMTVLEAARRNPAIERVVVTSSSEVYGPAQTQRMTEEHPLQPTSPYAASKVAADRMAIAYHRTYGTPVSIIRPFNTYGPRHVYDVIPKFIAQALAGQPLLVFGDGQQSRDFTYVDDMVAAFLCMGAHPDAVGEVVHFGSGHATTIAALAEAVALSVGGDVRIQQAPARAAEVARLCCDAGRASSLLGWSPQTSLAEGLSRNVAWMRERA